MRSLSQAMRSDCLSKGMPRSGQRQAEMAVQNPSGLCNLWRSWDSVALRRPVRLGNAPIERRCAQNARFSVSLCYKGCGQKWPSMLRYRRRVWRRSMKLNAGSPSAVSRRDFLKVAGAAAIVPGKAWASSGRPAASNRITMGVVGWGMMGPSNTKNFLAESDCQVVAACDLHKDHLQTAVGTVNTHYGNQDCKAYRDFREMIARDDIDAVMIAVPDQWHALLATDAANRKKDIYGEKPLARTIVEQQAIVKAVQQNGVIWQTGSWQRSVPTFHKAAE